MTLTTAYSGASDVATACILAVLAHQESALVATADLRALALDAIVDIPLDVCQNALYAVQIISHGVLTALPAGS